MHESAANQSPFGRTFQTLVSQSSSRDPLATGDSIIPAELDRALGDLLTDSLGDVMRFTAASAEDGESLFSRESGIRRTAQLSRAVVPAPIRGPLRTVRDLLVHPTAVPRPRLAAACGTIARWAWDENHSRLSMAYRQAAAMALPESSFAALELARVFRDLAQWHAAEQWLDRAERLAEEAGDVQIATRVLLARSQMMRTRGRYSEGEELLGEVLRRARASRADDLTAIALHGLCWLRARTGRLEDALQHAGRALDLYDPSHENIPLLLHEIAFIRMEQGEFAAALPLLVTLVAATPPHPRVAIYGSLARAAGGAGDEALFEETRDALDECAMNKRSAEAWLETARGALLLGDLEEAKEIAERAMVIAMERGEARTRYLAEDYLDAIAGEAAAVRFMRNTIRCADAVESLTTRLLASIRPEPGRS